MCLFLRHKRLRWDRGKNYGFRDLKVLARYWRYAIGWGSTWKLGLWDVWGLGEGRGQELIGFCGPREWKLGMLGLELL